MKQLIPITKLSKEELINLDLKSGLEIHQQLDGHKLFCSCPTKIRDDEADFLITRNLRAIAGESGIVDDAAKHESKKEKEFIYEGYVDTTCLVEIDEMPPQNPNLDAINSALTVAKMFNMNIFDEIRFMRKTVIDGSNTSGFQRTALVATDGFLNEEKKVRIETILIEEDSCKIIETNEKYKKYNLSRLGIPLIEIATGPDLKTPDEIKETSEYIGMVLRSLPNVKRGLGTIRQDINISIKGGVRVEIKGAQDLKLIPTLVEYEAIRQENMLNLFQELKDRNASVCEEITDLTFKLNFSFSKVLQSGLSKKDGCILGIRLKNFSGLLGFEIQPGRRYGSELSDYAKLMGVKGLFHSDELPNYGITQEEKSLIFKELNCDEIKDGFIIISDEKTTAKKAIESVITRAKEFSLLKCVRNANPNGTSSFMRPMSNASRMYPETDIKPVKIYLEKIKTPKLLSEVIKELKEKFNLAEDVCKKLIKEKIDLFSLSKQYPNIKPAYMVDYFFSLSSLIKKKYGFEINTIQYTDLIFSKLNKDLITKDSVIEILLKLNKNEIINYDDYKPLSIKDVEQELNKLIQENKGVPKGAIIGKIMSKYKLNPKELNDFLSNI